MARTTRQHDRRTICKVTEYVDADGREVNEFEPQFGKDKDPTFYKGAGMMKVQGMTPRGPVMQDIRFEFIFPTGTTLKKAFESYDEEAEKAVAAWRKQQQEHAAANKVVGAKSIPTGLLGKDGKPMGG